MADLDIFDDGGELYVDSRLIAERLGIQHESFMATVENYRSQTEEAFGVFRFEIGKPQGPQGGRPSRFVYLTEDQSTFLMTLSRNTPQVVQTKADLVVAFSSAKKLLQRQQQQASSQQHVPYWYQRMRLGLSDIDKPLQAGYFCAYEQMMSFFVQLEGRLGYIMPDYNDADGKYLVPDISIGLKFGEFMRSTEQFPSEARLQFLGSSKAVDFRKPGQRKDGWFPGGSHYKEIEPYNHVYPKVSHQKQNVFEANSYPNRYLSIFQYFLQEWWIADRCVPYLEKRDPTGVRFLQSAFNQLSPSAQQSLSGTLLGKLSRSLPQLPASQS